MKTTLTSRTPWHAVLRIAAAVLGGYMLTWGFIALVTASMYALGMEFHDAEHLSYLLGMLLYLTAFLWAFAAPRLSRVWLVFAGGGALMAVLASLLQSQLT
ncbi:iron uptake protein [Comamonas terrigena]|uniref:iron uptake protein n=1 Tax=Comamonas terrigena TaxID=32013 RepID=UPI00289AC888|nr:iron uptake protein [Comamonas terrigena]